MISNLNQVVGRSALKNSKTCPRQDTRGKPSSTVLFPTYEIEILTVLTSIGNTQRGEMTRRITFFC